MSARMFIGHTQVESIPANDRGLAYGDGLFETTRVRRGDVFWWDMHWARLVRGATRLQIPLPEQSLVRERASQLSNGEDGILKLIVTRGAGARGYASAPGATPHWVLSHHPLPPRPRKNGLVLRWCDTRLAIQPALAGFKHCNRLEQVIARGEWEDESIDDGLMRDTEGFVVSATSANLFVLRDGAWVTPLVDRCGVAGVCRAWAMAELSAIESRLGIDEVESAEVVFLCNAVRGILPVVRLGGRMWSPHPQVTALQARLARAHPAFGSDPEAS